MTKHSMVGALLVAGLVAGACEGKPEQGQDTAATSGAVPVDTAEVPNNPPPPVGGASANEQHIAINNTMTHAMLITAQVGGQTQQLGTVQSKARGDFFVQAPSGTTVQLAARDSAGTHQVQGNVVVADSVVTWVIK